MWGSLGKCHIHHSVKHCEETIFQLNLLILISKCLKTKVGRIQKCHILNSVKQTPCWGNHRSTNTLFPYKCLKTCKACAESVRHQLCDATPGVSTDPMSQSQFSLLALNTHGGPTPKVSHPQLYQHTIFQLNSRVNSRSSACLKKYAGPTRKVAETELCDTTRWLNHHSTNTMLKAFEKMRGLCGKCHTPNSAKQPCGETIAQLTSFPNVKMHFKTMQS